MSDDELAVCICTVCSPYCDCHQPVSDENKDFKFLRSPLAKAAVARALHPPVDPRSRLVYTCNTEKLTDDLAAKFVEVDLDQETSTFLDECESITSSMLRYYYHSFARSLMGKFVSQTSINGLLNRGQMFVMSTPQFEKLMTSNTDVASVSDLFENSQSATLLDVGAGDGAVTEKMSPFFSQVYATEMSPVMVYRLNQKGFTAVQSIDLGCPELADKYFDVITCLNVLDRCDKPLTLCRELRAKLKSGPGSRIVMAVVLPFCPFVDDGAKQKKPKEYVRILGNCWEDFVDELVRKVFTPCGLEVVTLSRVPYISQGDFTKAVYMLDDALFVLKPVNAER